MIPVEYIGDQEERHAWKRRTILRMIAEAAEEGRICPSNIELAAAIGTGNASYASWILHRLQADRRIEIIARGRGRIVRVCLTGATTADPTVLRARAAINAASEIWGIPTSRIVGPERAKRFIYPRYAAILAAHEMGAPYTQIGNFLARDHSTICHSVKQARAWEKCNPAFADCLRQLREKLAA